MYFFSDSWVHSGMQTSREKQQNIYEFESYLAIGGHTGRRTLLLDLSNKEGLEVADMPCRLAVHQGLLMPFLCSFSKKKKKNSGVA